MRRIRTLDSNTKREYSGKPEKPTISNKAERKWHKKAERIVTWFENIQIIFPGSKFIALPVQMKVDRNLESFIAEKLNQLDTGIQSADVESAPVDINEYAEKYDIPKEIMDDINANEAGIFRFNDQYLIFSPGKENKTVLVQLKLKHSLNHKDIKFDIDEESDGTQRLLDLLPMIFATGHDTSIYFVDEIDRSLHTKLSQYLLSDFAQRAKEGSNQMIFTAHEISLIDLHLFRQDEIWFIDKNQTGESKIKPLSDFLLQEGMDTIKAYLSGRFGAVPMVRRDN